MPKDKIRIIPLGGLGEIGRNMLVIEHQDDIVVVDAGLMFPEEEMLGVDLVIPDITYLLERRDKVRALIVTHGHEDHAGALPYVLPRLNVPVYATRLAHGLISVRLKEHKLAGVANLNVVQPGDELAFGSLHVELFRVNHSIPDAVGLVVRTPVGTIVHSGDFKFDFTPVGGMHTDFGRLAAIGAEGVLLLLSDSTYAEEPGYTRSEREVGATLGRIMAEAPGRVIIATFASLIARVQQVIDEAAKQNRTVFFIGRSMVDNVRMAFELGYLHAAPGVVATSINDLRSLPDDAIVIVTTGSQGEPTSVLARLANRDHRLIHVVPGDTIVVSASPIPGNEGLINRTINNLFRQGANVLYGKIADVHVHGHGSQEELKMMISLIRPHFFVPVHGEHRQLVLHSRIAESLGIPPGNSFVLEDGDILEVGPQGARVTGKVPASFVYVDGLGVGDIGQVVLRDRRLLSRDGILVIMLLVEKQTGAIVGQPDVISRGFIDVQESGGLIEEVKDVAAHAAVSHGSADITLVNSRVKDALAKFLYQQTKRRPMILPITVEV